MAVGPKIQTALTDEGDLDRAKDVACSEELRYRIGTMSTSLASARDAKACVSLVRNIRLAQPVKQRKLQPPVQPSVVPQFG
jgi:hypothetical protein